MATVLSSRKFEAWLQDTEFRAAFPEFAPIYQAYDQTQVARKAQGLCTGCNSMQQLFPRILRMLRHSLALSQKLKEYLGGDVIRYVDRSGRTAEVKTLI